MEKEIEITIEIGKKTDKEFLLKDYEQVRSELRNYSKNQFTILSILVPACTAVFEYSRSDPTGADLVFTTGFLIPALFAFFGVLWLDQIYRQKELGYYSCLLEAKMVGLDYDIKGWEHYVHMRHVPKAITKNSIEIIKHKIQNIIKNPFSVIKKLLTSANYYYYTIF